MATFTIIIPFYQREPGILRRALASVFDQTLQDFDILIVDDQSPTPIEGELAALDAVQHERITVIKQANAGPGGARNTGLDATPAATRFVAFLDSDDIWKPDHLANALNALTRFDADCYWASISGGAEFYYHFGMASLEESEKAERLSEDPLILEIPDLASVMLKNWSFLHLSCMVIGESIFRRVRFDASLRLAAEDVLFFCDCILASARTVLCDEAGAVRGEGVNIFHSIDSSSPHFLRQQFNTLVALETLQERFSRRPDDVAAIETYKRRARKQALWSQMRRMRLRKLPQIPLLAEWAWRDPRLLQSLASLGVGKLSR